MTAIQGVMPHRADGAGERLGATDDLSAYFATFRQSIRAALWPVWPNNLGVGDMEIINATIRAIDELVERRRADDCGM